MTLTLMESISEEEQYAGLPKGSWLTIHSVALTVIILSMTGSSYIIFRTAKSVLASRAQSQFPVVGILPALLAVADFCFGLAHGLDHILSLSQGHVTTGDACIALAFVTNIFLVAPAFISGYIAFFIWSVVVREKKPVVGAYYWRTLLWCFGGPLSLVLLQFIVGQLGPELTWCGSKTHTGNILFQTLEMLANIVISSVLYMSIQRKLRKHLNEVLSGDSEDAQKLEQTIRRLPSFVLVYIIQFTPWVIYTFASGGEGAPVGIIVVVVAIVNGGGVANAFAYRRLLESAEKTSRESGESHGVRSRSSTTRGKNSPSAISLEPQSIDTGSSGTTDSTCPTENADVLADDPEAPSGAEV
ncbi:MAG: hypothetical protein MHM6MM_000589 [Cercozoa sp. M6MM]